MTDFLAPMTKLDAVNICLSSMGEPVVNSLEEAAVDAQMASGIVDETTTSVQSIGWHWNKERHTFTPDIDGNILLPNNIIRVVTSVDDFSKDYIARGLKLFDRSTNSFVFTETVTVDIHVALAFDDVPLAAKQYIAARAARITQQRLLGNETLYKMESEDERRAWVILMQEEADVTKANVLTDNWSTASILNRGHFARGAY